MTLDTLFDQINTAFRGTDDDAPTDGTPDWDLWLGTTVRKLDEGNRARKWTSNFKFEKPNEPGTGATAATTTLTGTSTHFTDYAVGDTLLVSGETVRTIATIASDTSLTVTVAFSNTASGKTFTHKSIIADSVQSYSLHRNFYLPSDSVVVIDGTDTDVEYWFQFDKPQERKIGDVYLSGIRPQLLTFQTTIESDSPEVGGELKVPGYYMPDEVTASTDIVPIDDPYWLVYSVAAELAFNDITYEDKAPDLQSKANNLWRTMIRNDIRGTAGYPRTAMTAVTRIPGANQ